MALLNQSLSGRNRAVSLLIHFAKSPKLAFDAAATWRRPAGCLLRGDPMFSVPLTPDCGKGGQVPALTHILNLLNHCVRARPKIAC
jgi:hypothetical protein